MNGVLLNELDREPRISKRRGKEDCDQRAKSWHAYPHRKEKKKTLLLGPGEMFPRILGTWRINSAGSLNIMKFWPWYPYCEDIPHVPPPSFLPTSPKTSWRVRCPADPAPKDSKINFHVPLEKYLQSIINSSRHSRVDPRRLHPSFSSNYYLRPLSNNPWAQPPPNQGSHSPQQSLPSVERLRVREYFDWDSRWIG